MTNKQILDDYLREMEKPADGPWYDVLLEVVAEARRREPRINSWVHFHDYLMMPRDHHTMDNFYGPDYFKDSDA